MAAAPSPFLQGNFAPVREETTAEDLDVIGTLPPDLDGLFVRNGPNPQFDPLDAYHWFDGDGMLHGTRIGNGRASYRNRWIRTRGFEREREEGRAIWTGLFSPPQFGNPDGAFKNTANTAFAFHAGELLALWEGGPPHVIGVPDLDTRGACDYGGKLTFPFTAHPKVDPASGEMAFFGYSPIAPYCTYGVVSAAGELVHVAPIEIPGPVMMHDMAITERFSILLDLPLAFDLQKALKGEPPLAFDRERPARWGVLPRHGGNDDVQWFETDPCYVFHTANAWEEGDEVVLVGCRMDGTDVLQGGADDANQGRMHRWRFDRGTGQVKEEALDDRGTDFPRIREDRLGRANRFSYNARFAAGSGEAPIFDGIVRYDQTTGAAVHHEHGPGRFGGEPVFAPRPGGGAEDDGWVLTYVHDEVEGGDELVVLDARAVADEPVARVRIPARIPYGFHAAWVPASRFAA